MFETFRQKWRALLFTRTQQQAFIEDLHSLIEDGVPANQAVQTISQLATGVIKEVADNILLKISEGKLLADGMQNWFSQPIVEIIRAGEEGGTLAENLSAAGRALAHQAKGFAGLVGSIVYPLAVIVMGLIVAIFIKHSVFVNFNA